MKKKSRNDNDGKREMETGDRKVKRQKQMRKER